MVSCEAVRRNIISIVNGAGTAAHGANYHYKVAAIEDGKWAGLLRPAAPSPDAGKIHSWMTTRTSFGIRKKTLARIEHYWGFRLRGYIQFWDNGDEDNSEVYVDAEIQSLIRAFALAPMLNFDQSSDGVREHDNLQGPSIEIQSAGNTSVHVINAYLGVSVFENL